ncbi:unnamed protein product [Paramecium sonneborni]|uniref:Uncharacterized protein n=1 Tax=Paramecium sonneborni TaxID=65129 RepID=A0A8S1MT14_9CILI|nr:unnamed protein product [Paramecium sonneborni]
MISLTHIQEKNLKQKASRQFFQQSIRAILKMDAIKFIKQLKSFIDNSEVQATLHHENILSIKKETRCYTLLCIQILGIMQGIYQELSFESLDEFNCKMGTIFKIKSRDVRFHLSIKIFNIENQYHLIQTLVLFSEIINLISQLIQNNKTILGMYYKRGRLQKKSPKFLKIFNKNQELKLYRDRLFLETFSHITVNSTLKILLSLRKQQRFRGVPN